MTDQHTTKGFTSAYPKTNIGVPRAVSDDEMTEYPQAKRRRDIDVSNVTRDSGMEIDAVLLLPASLPSQDDVLMEVCFTSSEHLCAHDWAFSLTPVLLLTER